MPLQKCCGQITVFDVLHYYSSQSDEKQSVGILSNDVTDDSSSGQDQPLEPKDDTKSNNSVTTVSKSLINPPNIIRTLIHMHIHMLFNA